MARTRGVKYAFKSVLIEEEEDSLGRVIHSTAGEWFRPDMNSDTRTRKLVEVRAIASLSGRHAAAIAGYEPFGFEEDLEAAVDIVSHVAGSNRQVEAYVNYLDIVAEETLRQTAVWRAVERMVDELLEMKTVKWGHGRDVIRSALGLMSVPDAGPLPRFPGAMIPCYALRPRTPPVPSRGLATDEESQDLALSVGEGDAGH